MIDFTDFSIQDSLFLNAANSHVEKQFFILTFSYYQTLSCDYNLLITAKESIKAKKSFFCEKVSACITEHLEQEVDSEKIFQVTPQILNTDGWIRRKEEDDNKVQDYEFMDESIEELVKHFEIPLRNAGFNSTIPELLKQWHELLEYGTEYLSLPYTPYQVTWRRIFTSPRNQTWKDLLILVELLFTIPVSNAKLERMFSKMKTC